MCHSGHACHTFDSPGLSSELNNMGFDFREGQKKCGSSPECGTCPASYSMGIWCSFCEAGEVKLTIGFNPQPRLHISGNTNLYPL